MRDTQSASLRATMLDPNKYDNTVFWNLVGAKDRANKNQSFKDLFEHAYQLVPSEHRVIVNKDNKFYEYPKQDMYISQLQVLTNSRKLNWQDIEAILTGCELPVLVPNPAPAQPVITPRPAETRDHHSLFVADVAREADSIRRDDERLAFIRRQSRVRVLNPMPGQPSISTPENGNGWNMNLLVGFMTALGAAAVAVSLTLLSGAAATITAVAGGAVLLAGVGFFAFGCNQSNTSSEKPVPGYSL